ncbi:unnamed protein product [Caenorhabditis angaria]|uniref:Uncharacterized protein n=1 Tax=Caenorhabditis angaria TaxID=860376 RepID=A0A9P1N128_9PELO|nr:unnamed protein product [Caenorhabditis angaria]
MDRTGSFREPPKARKMLRMSRKNKTQLNLFRDMPMFLSRPSSSCSLGHIGSLPRPLFHQQQQQQQQTA